MDPFHETVAVLIHSFIPLCLCIYLLYKFKSVFKPFIGNEWLRVNVTVLLIIECFFAAFSPLITDFHRMEMREGLVYAFIFQAFWVMINTVPTVNVVLALQRTDALKKLSFSLRQAIVFGAIVITCTVLTVLINYYENDFKTDYLKWAASYMIFSSALAGFAYLFYTYAEYEKRQLIQARELENSKLKELKTQAELEALQSKINPHFLYNALNSIAELTITNGKKAREMTIALSDLLRYTINHNETNFSTINEEVEMTKTYLETEKIRFEENLQYSINIEEGSGSFEVPRFILQPLAENAVKHGLKAADHKGKIFIDIKVEQKNLVIKVYDNGLEFKEDMTVGYGLKSVRDKLRLLQQEAYTLELINSPKKHVLLILKNISKHASA